MKQSELKDKFEEYCKAFGLKIDQSGFEGPGEGINRKYHTAKAATVFLEGADSRIGNRWRISKNLPKGCVTNYSKAGFCTASELYYYMEGALEHNKASVKKPVDEAKVAKLVSFGVTVRVIANKDAEDEAIVEQAFEQACLTMKENGPGDSFDMIEDDKECPFGSLQKDKTA